MREFRRGTLKVRIKRWLPEGREIGRWANTGRRLEDTKFKL